MCQVSLVAKSLRTGIAKADSVQELKQRLYETPSDLDEYYKVMLDSIDPFYQADSSRMLLCCMTASDSLPLGVVSLLDSRHKMVFEEDKELGTLLHFDTYSNMQRRLSARCMDLLEVCGIPKFVEVRTAYRGTEFLSSNTHSVQHELIHQSSPKA